MSTSAVQDLLLSMTEERQRRREQALANMVANDEKVRAEHEQFMTHLAEVMRGAR